MINLQMLIKKKYIQCFKFMLLFKKCPQFSNVCLCFFGADGILAHAKFCKNVAGVPQPFDQLHWRVGKVNTFETPEMHLYFNSDVLDGCLTIIFVGSFPYFKFLTKINSKVRQK